MRAATAVMLALALAAGAAWGGEKPRTWLDRAIADPRAAGMANPYAGDASAARAGRKLYERHCSSCHGAEAEGTGAAPSLRGPGVQSAAPGVVFWLLRNGSLRRGMPSWSWLPEEQRWQIVTWIGTLGREGGAR